MTWNYQQRIEGLVSAIAYLQLRVLEGDASREQVQEELDDLQRQVVALSKILDDNRTHSERRIADQNRENEDLRTQIEGLVGRTTRAEAKANESVREARKQQFYRQLVEAENRGLARTIKQYSDPRFMLEVVDDIQECPQCNEVHMDRLPDNTCVCRYCGSRYLLDIDERPPF
jgi:rubrerythrin